MHHKVPICELAAAPGVALYHTGPPLDLGPLPALFYFALSGPDTLCLDPFNQPVRFLQGKGLRIFSMTLPGHENGLPATGALRIWAEDMARGIDWLEIFLQQAEQAIQFVLHERLVDPDRLAVTGLSRGGFIASHLAARVETIRFVLEFAPVTRLGRAREFSELQELPFCKSLDTTHLAEHLCHRHVRLYIGNEDMRVGTRECFEFAMALVAKAREKKIRSPQIELFISPSIGLMGHGTSPEIFRQGAHWISECLHV